MEGREIVLHSNRSGNGKFGGVAVKHGSYTNKTSGKVVETVELSVSKLGTFQLVEVHNANGSLQVDSGQNKPLSPQVDTKVATTPPEPVKSHSTGFVDKSEGQRQGMCFKLAGDFHLRTQDLSEDDFVEVVKRLAVKLIVASKEMDPK